MTSSHSTLSDQDLVQGTQLLTIQLSELQENDPEIADFHSAFELYCSKKFALGSYAKIQRRMRTGGEGALGIDVFCCHERKYIVGQCTIPPGDWLAAHPGKIQNCEP